MRRFVLSLLVLLGIFVVLERRLSDGVFQATSDPIPPLWEEVRHRPDGAAPATVGGAAVSITYCAFVTSTDIAESYPLTPVENGVLFDIDADGGREQVSWPKAGSNVSFLALDGNDDGLITSGAELVGNYAVAGGKSGPDALLSLVREEPGGRERPPWLDVRDAIFQRLVLWTDRNYNGVSERRELRPARESIAAISLGFQEHHRRDAHGNESRYRGVVHVRTAPGRNDATSPQEDAQRRRPLHHLCLVARER
jgi:hypothetical protein